MDTLLDQIEKIISASNATGIKSYILYLGDTPIIVTLSQLKTLISRTYNLTRSESYLNMPDEMLSAELQRAKQKLKEGR